MATKGTKSKNIKPIRVWVTEFAVSRVEAAAPFGQLPAVARQVLDVGAGPVESVAMGVDTRWVRVVSMDGEVTMMVGVLPEIDPDNPDATLLPELAAGILLPRLRPEAFGVMPGMVLSFMAVP